MKIHLAGPEDRARWDAYLQKSSKYPPLNLYGWRDILEKTYGVRTYFFFVSDEGGEVRGVLPAYVVRDLKNRKRLYSLRFGLVADGNEVKRDLVSHLEIFLKENGITSAIVTSGYEAIGEYLGGIAKKTVTIGLGQDEASTWRSLRDKTRNMIRKAVKSGMTSERGFGAIKDFYRVYESCMLKKGIPAHSMRFFENIGRELNGNAELITAKMEGRAVAGMLVLFSEGSAIYPFQASLPEIKKYAPNDFLVWEAARLCLEKGIRTLDMGECTEGGNVYRFKQNFGGIPRNIYYYSIPPEERGNGPAGPRRMGQAGAKAAIREAAYWLPGWAQRKIAVIRKAKGRII